MCPYRLRWGSIGFGFYDTATFGLFGIAYGEDVRAQTNGGYFIGAAIPLAIQIGTGAWSVTALRGAGGAMAAARTFSTLSTAQKLAVGITAYSLVGDAVGVAQSTRNALTGNFSATDLLGFAPSIGWAGAAARGTGGLTRIAGTVDNFAPAATVSRATGAAPNSGLLPVLQELCFVADTQVAVPDNYEGHFFAGYAPDPDDGSGSWVACGLASLLGASVLLGDRKKRSRQIPDSNAWDAEGRWWIADDPDLDVSELDFEDVCDELLTGSPGMS